MMIGLSNRQQEILDYIEINSNIGISDIKISEQVSIPTLNRDLAKLVDAGCLLKSGKARATIYSLSDTYQLTKPVDLEEYFFKEVDERNVQESFNFKVFDKLKNILSEEEASLLHSLKEKYQKNIREYPESLYNKEIERLTIELSWKSSQIEGNTYSLLETEILFREKQEAQGKDKEEAVMLLNHKEAFNYLLKHANIGSEITIRTIEELHTILIQDLGVGKNIRSRTVGITGTSYTPIDNEHQIKEALSKMCELINSNDDLFEKALLALLLISYIQPFEDGNKRTARIVSNAILIANGACPLSFRSVDSIEYKKAMLLFYEQNNISAFKNIFVEQNIFTSESYFK